MRYYLTNRAMSFTNDSLFGITLLQGYLYYVNYSKDWLYQRVAVIAISLQSLWISLTGIALSGRIPHVRHISSTVGFINLIKERSSPSSHRVCDALHLALTIHAMYHYLITSIGDPRAQFFVVWFVRFYAFIGHRELTHPRYVGAWRWATAQSEKGGA